MSSRHLIWIAASFGLFLVLLLPLRDGFTDDGYIHIQYASNIITRGEYSFNPGEVSFGTTSPFWVIVQSSLGLVFGGGERLIVTSRVVSWICGFLSLIFLYIIVRKLGGSTLVASLASLSFAADAWFVRWTALSMETSAAVLIVIWMGIASVGAFEDSRSAWLFGFLMGIAALIRPEAYLLLPVYIVALPLHGRPLSGRMIIRTLAVYAVLLIPWLLFAKIHIGSYLPNTAGAKSGGLILNPVEYVRKFNTIVRIIASTQGLQVLAILCSLFILRRRSRLLSKPYRFLLLWIFALPFAYVLFDIQVLSRYLLLVMPFITVFALLALEELLAKTPLALRSQAVALGGFASVCIVISAVFYFIVVVPPSRAFSDDLTHRLKSLAEYVKASSEEDAVVAAADIGYLAFYSDRRILDLGGLVEPEMGKLREQYPYEEIIQKGLYLEIPRYPHVDYFIDRERMPNRFEGRLLKGHRFESVLVKRIDNLGIRRPGPYYYTLYRIHREGDG